MNNTCVRGFYKNFFLSYGLHIFRVGVCFPGSPGDHKQGSGNVYLCEFLPSQAWEFPVRAIPLIGEVYLAFPCLIAAFTGLLLKGSSL